MRPFSETLAELIPMLPADWPGRALPVMPGDLTGFMPQGLGLAAPLVLRPWDNLEALAARRDYYGFDRPDGHPMRSAPSTEPAGGLVYFDHDVPPEDLNAVLRVIGVRDAETDFVVFAATAEDAVAERYPDQIRIMTVAALSGVFGATREGGVPRPDEPITIGALMHRFVELQRERWGTGYSAELSGTLGGDGDWAKESLAFGLMVENTYWGVYRLWSRPWLVTK